ncbi:hypothetical protein LRS10_22765 [Phenylobacterium sp. J426]|uniref:hypothetical protein n=1 Tax=Phenylobacterium sp. J426 TaxID=2898439 RepID=UPI002150F2E7|nr:hypothetical protein [Phenylobacterium sp. J426]MCR5876729.1 hypothetical protein [Phenylobacterium sp. J426]
MEVVLVGTLTPLIRAGTPRELEAVIDAKNDDRVRAHPIRQLKSDVGDRRRGSKAEGRVGYELIRISSMEVAQTSAVLAFQQPTRLPSHIRRYSGAREGALMLQRDDIVQANHVGRTPCGSFEEQVDLVHPNSWVTAEPLERRFNQTGPISDNEQRLTYMDIAEGRNVAPIT